MTEPSGGTCAPSTNTGAKHYVKRYDTLAKAHAEIIHLCEVCEDWRRKYEGWRDACLSAEDGRNEALAALRKLAEVGKSDVARLGVAEAKVALIEAVADLLGQEGRSREDAAAAELIRAALDRGARMAGER